MALPWLLPVCLLLAALSPATVSAIAGFSPQVSGQVKEYNLTFTTAFLASDCVDRQVIVVNNQLPGPTIDINRGERVRINVINGLYTDALSVHFHGVTHRDPWMDGSSYGAQCPILPGGTFTYEFNVTDQVGTFWYHAHLSTLRAEGTYGAFIVRPNPIFGDKEPFTYDEERLLFLGDWYHKDTKSQLTGLDRALPLDFRFVGEPQSLLLNQKGVFNCTISPTRTLPATYDQECVSCNNSNPDCTNQPIVTVTPGKTYRLRLINSAGLSYLAFQVEKHNLTVVAVDAVPVQPFNVTYVDFGSGERYDVLLTANQPPSNYWLVTQVRMRPPATPPGNWVLNYAGVPNTTLPAGNASALAAATPIWNDVAFSLGQVRQIVSPPNSPDVVPPTANRTFTILASQNRINGQIRWAQNGVAWTFPQTPLLHTEFFNVSDGYTKNILTANPPIPYDFVNVIGSPDSFPLRKGQGVLDVLEGEVIDIVMQNGLPLNNRSEAHPWYFHGNNVWVLGYGLGNFNASVDTQSLNLVNPPLRRMFMQWPKGWTYLRWKAEVAGVWLLHCHIESHFHMGMGFAFNVIPKSGSLPPPPVDTKICGTTTWTDVLNAYLRFTSK